MPGPVLVCFTLCALDELVQLGKVLAVVLNQLRFLSYTQKENNEEESVSHLTISSCLYPAAISTIHCSYRAPVDKGGDGGDLDNAVVTEEVVGILPPIISWE